MVNASWFSRVGSFIIDWLPYGIIVGIGAGISGGKQGAIYYLFLLIGIALWGYNRWFQAGSTGQSWGKKLLGTRLVGEQTGQPIGAGMAFVRDLAHILDGLPCLIGYLFPLWDAKRQTFADKLLKTVVVSA